MSDDSTKALQDAIAEAEELIANAPFIKTEQDLLEGYDYLPGRIRMAMQMAFDHDLDRPLFINPTHQFSRQGLDNPDAIYFNAYLKEGVEYVVRGRRGTSADLSFQVMGGAYSADSAATSMLAFDDRELEDRARRQLRVHLRRRARREDDDRARGLQRLGHRGARHDLDRARRHDRPAGEAADARAGSRRSTRSPRKLLVGSIQTWFAFPQFFQYKEPVNQPTPPQSTPGGLASQRSSIGHYELADDEALIVTVPECADCAYQAIQIGSDWYASTDYETHQTSLTKAQAVTDPDGKMRFVISEHARPAGRRSPTGSSAPATAPARSCCAGSASPATSAPRTGRSPRWSSSPTYPTRLPHFTPITTEEYAARIAARQRSVARRMIS